MSMSGLGGCGDSFIVVAGNCNSNKSSSAILDLVTLKVKKITLDGKVAETVCIEGHDENEA